MERRKEKVPGGLPSVERSERREKWSSGSRPTWETPEPSPEETEAMKRRFPEVVVFTEEVLGEELKAWLSQGVVVRSLGRWVSADSMAREIRWRGGMKGTVLGSQLDNGFALLRFELPEDRERALGRPWVVSGQVLALEPWRPGFFPVEGVMETAMVWVRLPLLPVEYWGVDALREVLRPAGELVAVDDWTTSRKRLGFARASIRIRLGSPLRPGVHLQGPSAAFWQRFTYENLEGVCFHCGRLHGPGACSGGRKRTEASGGGGRTEVQDRGAPDQQQGLEEGMTTAYGP